MDAAACAEPSLALHTLRQRLAERLGPGIGVACTGVDGDPQRLHPEEFAAVRRAVPRRQREFAAGRQAARQAMADIGWPPEAIPGAPDRSPVWPEGLTGSISHTGQACVAVVGPRGQWQSIGIDLENDLPMEPALWNTVCTPEELAFVGAQPTPRQGRLVTWLFSAKEAFYKWQYPRTRRVLDFQDVQVALNPPGLPTGFRVTRTGTHLSPGIEGHCLACQGHIATWVIGDAWRTADPTRHT